MASMYPSLEDMKVDQIQQAQVQAAQTTASNGYTPTPYPMVDPGPNAGYTNDLSSVYPSLMEEYMGLRLEPPSGPVVPAVPRSVAIPASHLGNKQMVAPLSGQSMGLARANVTHGIREVILCKDAKGKIGMKLREQSKGVFVQFVLKDSPASLGGIRFGDQILQVDGKNLAGMSGDKAMDMLKKANPQRIVLAVRDRPYERTVTLHKDSSGHVGFVYRDGEIVQLAKDTSAARNGLLIDHNILEINGQNVVGLKDKDLDKLFQGAGQVVTVTIMPKVLYRHMVDCMADKLMKKMMDHGVPDVC